MGSPNGLWTSVSGAMAQSQNLDVIANNLANVNTAGFKKDAPTFKEFLTAIERPPSPIIDIPRTIFKDSDFYHFDGREHAMVNLSRVHTDHAQGSLKLTNAPLDFAIDGPGFFTVHTPNGLMFTRAGDFRVNSRGELTTLDGHAVLALAGEAEAARTAQVENPAELVQNTEQPGVAGAPGRNPANLNPFTAPTMVQSTDDQGNPIQIPVDPANIPNPAPAQPLFKTVNLKEAAQSGSKIYVDNRGQIFAGENPVGFLALAEFADSKLLTKMGSNLYSNPNNANVPRASSGSKINQGFLELSNVNPVSELLELLKANRMFESNMRAIKAYNDMAGKEANEVGKL